MIKTEVLIENIKKTNSLMGKSFKEFEEASIIAGKSIQKFSISIEGVLKKNNK